MKKWLIIGALGALLTGMVIFTEASADLETTAPNIVAVCMGGVC